VAHRASPAVGVADAKQHSAPQPRAAAEAALPETALGVAFQDATDISQLRDAHRAPDARVAWLRMQRIVVELAGWEFRIRSSTVGFRKVPATHRYTQRLRRLGWCRHGRGDRGKWRQRGLQARRDRRRHSPQQPNRGRSYLSSKTIWRTLTHTVRKLREFANITEIGLASYSQRTVRVELLSERGREDFVSGVDSSNLPSSLRRRRKRTSAQQSESARRALPRRRRRRSALPFWRSARKRGAGRATRRSSATTTRSGARQTP